MNFHGAIAPGANAKFPLAILINLTLQGNAVPGTGVRHNFQKSSDVVNVSFSQIIQVNTAPAVLTVTGSGGTFLYSDISLSVQKISGTEE